MNMQSHLTHHPVLLQESIDALDIKPNGIYVDATFGRGGHSRAILDRLGEDGRLLVMDQDPDAIVMANKLAAEDTRVTVHEGSFNQLDDFVKKHKLLKKINGVLFDLGVSSPQLDDATRGFSFRHTGPLDMRMDTTVGEPVSTWLNEAREREIADIIYTLGEERFSRGIARAIVAARADAPIMTTTQLAELVASTIPSRERHKHPATRTFQALRIHINSELDALKCVLPQAVSVLAPQGRMAVISFHSLEDRIVKQFFKAQSRGVADVPAYIPLTASQTKQMVTLHIIGKPISPRDEETSANPRARSAKLRVAEAIT